MIRVSEVVLPGHPDKFCDQVADAVIAECVAIDPDAYGQVEVSTWSDQVWLSGGVCTRRPLAKSMRDIVVETGLAFGYVPGNHIDATRYQVTSTVCERIGDPTQWSRHVNDQAWSSAGQATTRRCATCRPSTTWRTRCARRCCTPAGPGCSRARGRTAS